MAVAASVPRGLSPRPANSNLGRRRAHHGPRVRRVANRLLARPGRRHDRRRARHDHCARQAASPLPASRRGLPTRASRAPPSPACPRARRCPLSLVRWEYPVQAYCGRPPACPPAGCRAHPWAKRLLLPLRLRRKPAVPVPRAKAKARPGLSGTSSAMTLFPYKKQRLGHGQV